MIEKWIENMSYDTKLKYKVYLFYLDDTHACPLKRSNIGVASVTHVRNEIRTDNGKSSILEALNCHTIWDRSLRKEFAFNLKSN